MKFRNPYHERFFDNDPRGVTIDNSNRTGPPFDLSPTPARFLAAKRRLVSEYDVEAAFADYMRLYPDADPTAVREEMDRAEEARRENPLGFHGGAPPRRRQDA